ncbi:transporter substrate-binding domain-containing protein [Lysobacter sp. S4-A87]|uniref:ATP-binding protein n=1 Tax=Lysobacter sp. S4-A87 TaxID=2925843 RepID=UPI001F52BBAC|nr:transporter substrate-binding domain-containing protein [Lysobacter sp. S4-A87]UNK47912.1 transporter substrate-binding domain-containing protein [Lysobacter sp. S4-A87]
MSKPAAPAAPSSRGADGKRGLARRLAHAVVILVLLAACATALAQQQPVRLTPEESAWRDSHRSVRIGVLAGDHLPGESWAAGRPEGFSVDYARLLVERAGMHADFRPYVDWEQVAFGPPGEHLPYDLLLGQAPHVNEPDRFGLLKPYDAGRFMLVARRDDTRMASGQNLVSARLVVERRFRGLATRLSERFPSAKLLYSDDGGSALEMVAAGQADAYIGATWVRTRMLMQQRNADDLVMLREVDIPRAPVSLAVPKDRPVLMRILVKAEATLAAADVERLRKRWGFMQEAPPDPPRAAGLDSHERAWLEAQRPLRVGYEIDRAPYSHADSEGGFGGVAADYVALLGRELGLRLELVPAQDWASLQKMVRARTIDIVAATLPEDFDSRDLLVSRPYAHFPGVIVTRQHGTAIVGPEDLVGRTVAARQEAGVIHALRAALPRTRLVPVGSNEAGLDMVTAGEVDAYVGTLPAIDTLIRGRYAAKLRIAGPVGADQEFAIGITPEHARLLPLVNRVLAQVTEAEHQSIRSRWLTTEYRYGVPWPWVMAGLVTGGVILLVGAVAYARLRSAWRAHAKAESELAAQLRFQQSLLETIPHPVFVKDVEGRYQAVNEAYESMFAVTRMQLLNRTLAQTHHLNPSDEEEANRMDVGVLVTGRRRRMELRLPPLQPQGKPRDVILWLHRFNLAPDQVGGLLGTLVDVSDIREAEARARASEQRLIDTNDRLPGVILRISVQPGGRIVYDYIAGQTQALFGRSRSELLRSGRRMHAVATGEPDPVGPLPVQEEPDHVLAAINEIVASGTRHEVEFRMRVKGEMRWTRASSGTPRREADGSVVWCIYFADITDEKQQAQALVEATDAARAAVLARSSFLAMMSHEIRTPMAGVLGLVELMAHAPMDREQARMLGMVQDSAGSLLQILDDVLDFSRIESGRLDLDLNPFDLRTVADNVMGLFSARAHEKRVRLYATIDWRLAGTHQGDAVRIRQVITNLVSNALKFTESGHVELRIELAGEEHGLQRIRIRITDTGIGIEPQQLARLFQPFVQADDSISRRFGGTGLGLSICQRLAQMMGGSVHVASTRGQGTTSTLELSLPIVSDVEPHEKIVGKTALLCTRDPMFERELANTLSTLGFNLMEVGPDELREAQASDAELFVVDIELVREGCLPDGARYLCLVDSADVRGFQVDDGEVSLSGSPLLTAAAAEACCAALGLEPPNGALPQPGMYAPRAARILVAEDHMTNRAVIARQLERLGYAHTLVEDGEQALEALTLQSYDLLISDCHMPLLDGFALTRRIREQEAGTGRHLPIVALSASALPEEVRRCHDAGMDDFLAKPVQMLDLDRKLSTHLQHALPEPVPEITPISSRTSRKLARLTELFGGEASLREVLEGLLDSSRRDMAALDVAVEAGDEALQRDILHRIDGALLLLAEGDRDPLRMSHLDHTQRRSMLDARIGHLETVIATLDPGRPVSRAVN